MVEVVSVLNTPPGSYGEADGEQRGVQAQQRIWAGMDRGRDERIRWRTDEDGVAGGEVDKIRSPTRNLPLRARQSGSVRVLSRLQSQTG